MSVTGRHTTIVRLLANIDQQTADGKSLLKELPEGSPDVEWAEANIKCDSQIAAMGAILRC